MNTDKIEIQINSQELNKSSHSYTYVMKQTELHFYRFQHYKVVKIHFVACADQISL